MAFGVAGIAGGMPKGGGTLREQGRGYCATGGAVLRGESGDHDMRGRNGEPDEYEKLHRLGERTAGSEVVGGRDEDFGAGA